MDVAIVTDSTSSLPPEDIAAAGVSAVPLHVVVDGEAHVEGDVSGLNPAELAERLRAHASVTTSRPTPESFLAAYRAAAEQGARSAVSIHLSAELSGTAESARMAAADSPIPVEVVDTRLIGMATGFVVLGAAADAAAARQAADIAARVRQRCDAATALLYVDTLEHLRRGGRIGGAAALLGSALSIKPILHVSGGRVEPLERVRTRAKALARLVDLGLTASRSAPDWASGPASIDLAVQHVDARARADEVAAGLADGAGGVVHDHVRIVELSAVVGAHVGPGTVGVAVVPRLP